MKRAEMTEEGQLHCPHCGAANSFTSKRSRKAKLLLAPVPISILAAPKRLRCMNCGASLKEAQPVSTSPNTTHSTGYMAQQEEKEYRRRARRDRHQYGAFRNLW
jgi:phage FluMu protein Com